MKILIVGDDNFTFSPCLLENITQWKNKLDCPVDEDLVIEIAWCFSESKIPSEAKSAHDKLKAKNVMIYYNVNPALLRQYFPQNPIKATFEINKNSTGPPYDGILCVLPGLSFEGCPRFIEKTSQLFQLRLHLYWFAVVKSSTVIVKPSGRIMFLWIDQENYINKEFNNEQENNDEDPEKKEKSSNVSSMNNSSDKLPFPLIDIHKIGPFCKLERAEDYDFTLDIDTASYKTDWKPLIHNVELWNFPSYLNHIKVYVLRNKPYVSVPGVNPDDYNLLRIPQSICQWNRAVLPHVNELFHFSLQTSTPGEMMQISKLSVKYDPRINGWRNLGAPTVPPVVNRRIPPNAPIVSNGRMPTQMSMVNPINVPTDTWSSLLHTRQDPNVNGIPEKWSMPTFSPVVSYDIDKSYLSRPYNPPINISAPAPPKNDMPWFNKASEEINATSNQNLTTWENFTNAPVSDWNSKNDNDQDNAEKIVNYYDAWKPVKKPENENSESNVVGWDTFLNEGYKKDNIETIQEKIDYTSQERKNIYNSDLSNQKEALMNSTQGENQYNLDYKNHDNLQENTRTSAYGAHRKDHKYDKQ